MKLEQNSVNTTKKEINRRILNGLPSVFNVKKKMFLMMADIELDELGGALARIDDSRTRDGSAGGTHALVTGIKPRGNGQGRGSRARGGRGGRGSAGRGKHDDRGHQHGHQKQRASQPPAQHQQQQPQKHQRQPQKHQQQQQQRPSGHPGRWGQSRVCFRCHKPGHVYAECRAIPPAPLNTYPPAPYTAPRGDSQENYSTISPGNYAFSPGGDYGQQMPTPPAPHGPPVPSDSSCNFSIDRAVMTQFCPPGEFVSSTGIVSNSLTRIIPPSVTRSFSSNYLPSDSQHNPRTAVATFV